jgi:hypothetical protein
MEQIQDLITTLKGIQERQSKGQVRSGCFLGQVRMHYKA